MITMSQLQDRLASAENHHGRLEHYLRGSHKEPYKVRRAIAVLKKYEDTGEWPFVNVIGRCKVKGCKHTARVKVHTVLSQTGYASNTQSLAALGQYACPEHNQRLHFKELEGTVNKSVPCDRRCTGARGHKCECSCGGANHGKDHDFD